MDKPEVTPVHLGIGLTVLAQVEIRSNLGRRGHRILRDLHKENGRQVKGAMQTTTLKRRAARAERRLS